jgi:uncharacterized protein with PIN domain
LGGAGPSVLPSSWWADEMLGRLARYLRIVGLDTTYEPGVDDEELLRRIAVEDRVLITRDRVLARRALGSALLTAVRIEDQWAELFARYPDLPIEPKFARCTICNGRLIELVRTELSPGPSEVPVGVVRSALPLFNCETCGHVYWEGSHTDSVRRRLASWTRKDSS